MGGSRLTRWRGLVGIGWRRVHHRLGRGGSRQTLVTVLGIALPVALLLLVGSVSLGLTADPGAGQAVDYWIVPEGASSAVTSVDSAQLGETHPTAAASGDRDEVSQASRMLQDFAVGEGPDGSGVYLVAFGEVPPETDARSEPLSVAELRPGDPYFANGTYDGDWSGEIVLSESASTTLGTATGESLRLRGSDREFTVSSVESPQRAGLTQFPIAVMHLSELQALTGADERDSADQLVVVAPDGTARTERALANVYPNSNVETRGGLLSERGTDSRLPAAMAFAALLIVLTTGTLLVSTAFGFELAADSESRQVLSAIGLAGRSRAGLIGTELGVVSLYGGVLGVVLWGTIGIVINRLATARFGAPVASLDPRFALYGIGVAVLIGLLSLPYLLVVGWRSGGEALRR
jgi:putative ABC transport system permease protein